MAKSFYFKSVTHFLNFCNKYESFEKEELENLSVLCERAICNDKLSMDLISKLTYFLRFDSGNNKIKYICEISKFIESPYISEIVVESGIFNEDLKSDISYQYKNSEIILSDNFVKSLEKLRYSKGLYFFYDEKKELIYIGKSRDLGRRILSSTRERNPYFVKYKITRTMSDANVLELYYISKIKPVLNRESKEIDKTTFEIIYKFLEESDFISIRGGKNES